MPPSRGENIELEVPASSSCPLKSAFKSRTQKHKYNFTAFCQKEKAQRGWVAQEFSNKRPSSICSPMC